MKKRSKKLLLEKFTISKLENRTVIKGGIIKLPSYTSPINITDVLTNTTDPKTMGSADTGSDTKGLTDSVNNPF